MADFTKFNGYTVKDPEARRIIEAYQEEINGQFETFKTSINTQLAEFKGSTNQANSDFQSGINNQFTEFQADINERFIGFQNRLNEQLSNFENSTDETNATFQNTITTQLEIFKTKINSDFKTFKSEVEISLWDYIRDEEVYTYGFESTPPSTEMVNVVLPSNNVNGFFYRVSDDVPSEYNFLRSTISFKEEGTQAYASVEELLTDDYNSAAGCWFVSDKMVVVYDIAENNALNVHPGIFLKYDGVDNYTMSFGYTINNRETLDNMHKLHELIGEIIAVPKIKKGSVNATYYSGEWLRATINVDEEFINGIPSVVMKAQSQTPYKDVTSISIETTSNNTFTVWLKGSGFVAGHVIVLYYTIIN